MASALSRNLCELFGGGSGSDATCYPDTAASVTIYDYHTLGRLQVEIAHGFFHAPFVRHHQHYSSSGLALHRFPSKLTPSLFPQCAPTPPTHTTHIRIYTQVPQPHTAGSRYGTGAHRVWRRDAGLWQLACLCRLRPRCRPCVCQRCVGNCRGASALLAYWCLPAPGCAPYVGNGKAGSTYIAAQHHPPAQWTE